MQFVFHIAMVVVSIFQMVKAHQLQCLPHLVPLIDVHVKPLQIHCNAIYGVAQIHAAFLRKTKRKKLKSKFEFIAYFIKCSRHTVCFICSNCDALSTHTIAIDLNIDPCDLYYFVNLRNSSSVSII